MNKLPWFQFFPADWIKGTRELSPIEKGIWIDILSYLWESPSRGTINSTWEGLGRMLGISPDEGEEVILGMERKNLLVVTIGNADVTIVSRRMEREERIREQGRERKRRYDVTHKGQMVTGKKSEVRSQKSNTERDKDTTKTVASRNEASRKTNQDSILAPKILKTAQATVNGVIVPEIEPQRETRPIQNGQPTKKPPQTEFMDRFKASYESMTGQPFKFKTEQFVIVAKLIKDHGLDATVAKVKILGALCRDRSAWFTKGGWSDFSIEKLSGQWNSILATTAPNKDQELLDEIKRQEERHARNNELAKSTGNGRDRG